MFHHLSYHKENLIRDSVVSEFVNLRTEEAAAYERGDVEIGDFLLLSQKGLKKEMTFAERHEVILRMYG
jgi:hypothetical protein